MSLLEDVHERWGDLRYMSFDQAQYLEEFINKHDLTDLLELGFFHGKSSAYIAAVLETRGKGHLTTCDMQQAVGRKPNIETVLSQAGLSHRVTPIYSHRSFTWELSKMMEAGRTFDFCYIDGAHTWDGTGLSFLLVDMMLKPGGWLIFDDLDWSIAASEKASGPRKHWAAYGEEEKNAKQVRKVWELLVPRRGYSQEEIKSFRWGVAQKPL